MVLNFVVSFVPTDVTAVTITTEISAAISPYSMAFAPELSFKKRRKSSLTLTHPVFWLSIQTLTQILYTRRRFCPIN